MILRIRGRSTFRSGLIRLTKDRILPYRPATPRMSRWDREALLREATSMERDLDKNREWMSDEEVTAQQKNIDQMRRNARY